MSYFAKKAYLAIVFSVGCISLIKSEISLNIMDDTLLNMKIYVKLF